MSYSQEYTFEFVLRLNPSKCSEPAISGDLFFDSKVFKFSNINEDEEVIVSYTTSSFPSSLDFNIVIKSHGCGSCSIQGEGHVNGEQCFVKTNPQFCQFSGDPFDPEFTIEAYWKSSDYGFVLMPEPSEDQMLCLSDSVKIFSFGSYPNYARDYKVGNANWRSVLDTNPRISDYTFIPSDYEYLQDDAIIGSNLYLRVSTGKCTSTSEVPFILFSDKLEVTTSLNNPRCNQGKGKLTINSLSRLPRNDELLTYTLLDENNEIVIQKREYGLVNEFDNLSPGSYTLQLESNYTCRPSSTGFTILAPDPITISSYITNLDCNSANGGISIEVSGGNGPYSYMWEGPSGFTSSEKNLSGLMQSGTYAITLTDKNGCVMESTFEIIDLGFNISTFKSDLDCENSNGFIEMDIDGGSGPYSVDWSGPKGFLASSKDIYGLTQAGIYNYIITDDSGCSVSGTISIEKQNFDLTSSIENNTCYGEKKGILTLHPEGGSGQFLVNFEGKQSNNLRFDSLESGIYNFEITDEISGCSISSVVEIKQPDSLVLSLISDKYNGYDISCNGASDGKISSNITGGEMPYTIEWSNGVKSPEVDQLSPGLYSVQVTDNNNCLVIDSLEIREPPKISILLDSISLYGGYNVSCANSTDGFLTVKAMGGTKEFSYYWDLPSPIFARQVTGLPAGEVPLRVMDANGCRFDTIYSLSSPPALTVDYLVNGISCPNAQDASIVVQPDGGVAPYGFLWNNGLTEPSVDGLSEGKYSVEIRDQNGCSASTDIVVPNIKKPDMSPLISHYNGYQVSCAESSDGYVELNPASGSSAFHFDWSTGDTLRRITNLGAGEVSVVVEEITTGCTFDYFFELTEPEPIEIDYSISDYNGFNVSCSAENNGEIQLDLSGGTGNYTILWDDSNHSSSRINLSAGTYNVKISDENECSASTEIELLQPPSLHIDMQAKSYGDYNISCFGADDGALTAIVTGGVGEYLYEWSNLQQVPAQTNLRAGYYELLVADLNGCKATQGIELVQPDKIVPQLAIVDASCNKSLDGQLELYAIGGSTPFSYALNNDISLSGKFENLAAGVYDIRVQDKNNCSIDSTIVIREPSKAHVQLTNLSESQCGEMNGAIEVEIDSEVSKAVWFDTSGLDIGSGLRIDSLSSGLYTLEVDELNGCKYTYSYEVSDVGGVEVDSILLVKPTCFDSSDGEILLFLDTLAINAIRWGNGYNGLENSGLRRGEYLVEITDKTGCVSYENIELQAPLPISFDSLLVFEPSCSGSLDGAINIFASGGTGPFSYYLNNMAGRNYQFSGLLAEQYVIRVVDELSCSATTSIQLGEPSPISYTIDSLREVSCYGYSDGYLGISPSGGAGTYEVLWAHNSGLFNSDLPVGYAKFTIRDQNKCELRDSIYIDGPDELSFGDVSIIHPDCFDSCTGAIAVNPEGGVGGYSFFLDNQEQNDFAADQLCAGAYLLTALDQNRCRVDSLIDLIDPPYVDSGIADSIEVCSGQDIDIAIDAPSKLIQWQINGEISRGDSIVRLTNPGLYYFKYSDSRGCEYSDSVHFSKSDELLNARLLAPTSINANDTIVLIDVSWPQPDSIFWDLPEEILVVSDSIPGILEVVFPETGQYSLGMHVLLGECYSADNQSVYVAEALAESELSINGQSVFKESKAYPNPLQSDILTISLSTRYANSENVNLSILNLTAYSVEATIYLDKGEQQEHQINLGRLTSGTYAIIIDDGSQREILKVVRL